eukprot:scaffold2354_cov124-Isochrysis_galbana.AAC.10
MAALQEVQSEGQGLYSARRASFIQPAMTMSKYASTSTQTTNDPRTAELATPRAVLCAGVMGIVAYVRPGIGPAEHALRSERGKWK